MSNLEPQLAVAQNLVSQQHVETTEQLYILLSSMQTAFPDHFVLVCAALTAEHSFSALKCTKTYLKSTMGEEHLTPLSILSIEQDLSKFLDHMIRLLTLSAEESLSCNDCLQQLL